MRPHPSTAQSPDKRRRSPNFSSRRLFRRTRSTASFRRALIASSLLLLIFGFSAYTHADQCETPKTIRLLLLAHTFSPENSPDTVLLAEQLESETGIDVTVVRPTSNSRLLIAIKKKQFELALVDPITYVRAKVEAPTIEAFAAINTNREDAREKSFGYYSILISSAKRGLDTVESLKGRTLALVDAGSTSGFLIPRIHFSTPNGQSLDSYFTKILESGKHDLSIIAVAKGSVDAAFVASNVLDIMVANNQINYEDFNVLWRSSAIPPPPFIYKNTLCKDVRENITQALMNFHTKETGKTWLKMMSASGIEPVDDKDYHLVREAAGLSI